MSDLAEFVRLGDPDRYAATLAAPDAVRAKLWPLYAFNLEIARAPWVTREPMIAEMRLQFWADVLDEITAGKPARAHEVAAPLAEVWHAARLPVDLGHAMIAARRRDIYRDPFADTAELQAHLDATSGNLMWLAALALGASPDAQDPVRDMGFATGLSNWFQAVPDLTARGHHPLPDQSDDAIAALARSGLARLARARAARRKVGADVGVVLLSGWQAGPVLTCAARQPQLVRDGGLALSEFSRRGRLLLRAISGRW